MSDEKKMILARRTYEMLCDALDARSWNYSKEEEKLLVHFGVNGDDIPINFVIVVDAERQLVRVMSPLPFKMSEEKRMEGAIAACAAPAAGASRVAGAGARLIAQQLLE